MDERPRSLSSSEAQRLRAIEDGLERDDPDLAATLASAPHCRSLDPRTASSRRTAVLGAACTVGVAALVVGIIVAVPVVGAIGFAITVIATDGLLAADDVLARLSMMSGRRRDEQTSDT